MSSLAAVSTNTATPTDGNLNAQNTILDCAHTYILDKKIYVPNGKTLIVKPGALIKGRKYSTPDSATTLIVSRGGKAIMEGTAECMIVMTGEGDPMNGSYPIKNQGSWGGLVIAGQANNTFSETDGINGPFTPGLGDGKLAVADGLGTFDGFASSDYRIQHGVNLNTPQAGYNTTFDDNDNSGIYKYLSVRYAGSVLEVGGEINGISLGSVGRGTTIDHIEVISAADDNMEFFGGTVDVKNSTFMFGNDDMYDFDLGYSGRAQNIFSIKATDTTGGTAAAGVSTFGAGSGAADNGFECDSDDQQSGNGSGKAIGSAPSINARGATTGYRSHPVFYNCTMIGNNKRKETSDNSGIAAIMAKEMTEGEWYNCVFANFAIGLNLWTGNKTGEIAGTGGNTRVNTTSSTGQTVLDAYDNWRNDNGPAQSIIVKNCTFVGMGTGTSGASLSPLTFDVTGKGSYYVNVPLHTTGHGIGATANRGYSADSTQFYVTDGNVAAASLPGFAFNWSIDNTSNAVATKYDAIPDPSLATSTTATADGFFSPESYRGAFAANTASFLSPWAYATMLQTTGSAAPCPTDVSGPTAGVPDGITNNTDFLYLLGQFNHSCNE
jgi:hypothetical protein